MRTQPKPTKIIFDMDGTLYRFSPDCHLVFNQTKFYVALCERILNFVCTEFDVDRTKAQRMLTTVDRKFNGELSVGFEREYGIDRHRYFNATWDCQPRDYFLSDQKLAKELKSFAGSALLLTSAPRTWANRVLEHLGVADIFGDRIITGEPDIRKPDPEVFKLAAARLGVDPTCIISVGDQNASDILPAKSLGMTTVIVGSHQHDADHHASTIYEAINLIKEKLL